MTIDVTDAVPSHPLPPSPYTQASLLDHYARTGSLPLSLLKASPPCPPELLSHTLKHLYDQDGFVIVDDVIEDDLQLHSLRTAAEAATERVRKGDWKYRRIVGKQFPPFDEGMDDYWGVQHVLHPSLLPVTSGQPSPFAAFYSSPTMLFVITALLSAPEERLQMELFNLLINPERHDFALGFHRDDVRPEVDEEEMKTLETPTFGVQWNTALYPDSCLFVVPGTHARVRTPAERKANLTPAPPVVPSTPLADASSSAAAGASEQSSSAPVPLHPVQPSSSPEDPPTTARVCLRTGQSVFYSQRILHRAQYISTEKRRTLHGCNGDVGEMGQGGGQRARNVLQHEVAWMRDPAFGASLPARLQPQWKRLLEMENQYRDQNLGYSLVG